MSPAAQEPRERVNAPAPGSPAHPAPADRLEHLFGLPVRKNPPDGGPWHLERAEHEGLSWCGVKSQYRHRVRVGGREDVTCPKCLTAIRTNRPRAWKG